MVIISSYWWALENAERLDPDYIVSLMDAESPYSLPIGPRLKAHLRLDVHDITTDHIDYPPPYVVPSADHVRQLIDFGNRWAGDGTVLVHCAAGISRSTAAALILVCQRNSGKEHEAVQHMREQGPWAYPNALIIKLGDNLLACEGRLIEAVDNMGMPTMRGVETPIQLPVDL